MITRDDVVPLLLAACPSFAAVWADLEHDPLVVEDDGTRLHYADAGRVADHLVGRFVAGDRVEVAAALAVVERMHLEGDAYVRELATIGYLEDLQDAARRHPACAPEQLEPLLGAESLRWWRGLDAFWSGQAPTVLAQDDEPGSQRQTRT
ncbi:DUF7674 family protein [Nocardioides nanhaiensis]|uniref:DUF7674 domain-containing protein n=1 Tax=Nocardioides nanhaiensis TaxID=1476871 RepID=A0ABP8VQX7_9ACTN